MKDLFTKIVENPNQISSLAKRLLENEEQPMTPTSLQVDSKPSPVYKELAKKIAGQLGGSLLDCDVIDPANQREQCTVEMSDGSCCEFVIDKNHSDDLILDGVRWKLKRPEEDMKAFREKKYKTPEAMIKDMAKFIKSTK